MLFRRLFLGVALVFLTAPVPLSLSACARLRTNGICCRTCPPEQKACGNGCIRHDEPCRAATGCACDSRQAAQPTNPAGQVASLLDSAVRATPATRATSSPR